MWTMQDTLEDQLFSKSIKGITDIKVSYLDIADIHEFNHNSNAFFNALAGTD